MALIRTWTNSWFTSYRMNEPVKLKCISGCDDRDDLSHYIGCEVLWTLVNSVCNAQACCLQSSVCCHLLLETAQPSSDDIVKLFLAFNCYHALKSNYMQVIVDSQGSSDFDLLFEHACSLLVQCKGELKARPRHSVEPT